jgi:hypothetical protein
MAQRVFWPDCRQALSGGKSKRASGGGEHHPLHPGSRLSLQALEDGAMLAIDRYDFSTTCSRGFENERATANERFLVRQRYSFSSRQSSQSQFQTSGTDQSVQNDIHVRSSDRFQERIAPCPPVRVSLLPFFGLTL